MALLRLWKPAPPAWVRQPLPTLRRYPLRAALALLATVAALAWWFCLPDPLFSRPLATVLLARDGSLLGARVAADGQWRFPPVQQLPPKFRAALLAAEDKRFDSHLGVDPLALARALRLNLAQGRVVSGGSTISMQTVRLARDNPPRDLREKATEALMALRLEARFSKDQILALYASHAPFGGNTVGLNAAAWRYFGHSSEGLSWAESATLAVLPNQPALIHPGRRRDALRARRDTLLRRMQGRGLLSATDLTAALHEPLPEAPQDLPQAAPHLLQTLRAQPGSTPLLASTLDARLQARVLEVVAQQAVQLRAQQVGNAAVVVIDHQRHELLAYVGNLPAAMGMATGVAMRAATGAAAGATTGATTGVALSLAAVEASEAAVSAQAINAAQRGNTRAQLAVPPESREDAVGHRAHSSQGLAVDIVQRPRSTGSLLKPFLYATMLDAGELLPQQLVPDVPTQLAGWAPQNYDHAWRGAVPADEALARSLNVPMVRLLREHGVARFHDELRLLGMSTLQRTPDAYGLSLVLGGAEGSLWEMTQMYAGLANAARGQPVQAARWLMDSPEALAAPPAASPKASATKSSTTPSTAPPTAPLTAPPPAPPSSPALISPGAAWLTLQALLEVARPGDEAHWRDFSHARHIAWKTGTSYGLRDAWAIGVSGRYAVGVWAGNAGGEGRPGLTGAAVAAPLLFAVFNQLDSAPWFDPPSRQMKTVQVCRDDGFLADGLCETRDIRVPLASHFSQRSPHHRRLHLAPDGLTQVHDGCESPQRMRHQAWFVLSPAQAVHYRRERPGYRPLPPWRADCAQTADTALASPGAAGAAALDDIAASRSPSLELVYPHAGAKVYVPMDLAARKGRVVLQAAHRDADAGLLWHLDGQFLGRTQLHHQQAVDLAPGWHQLTVVDESGQRATRRFEVLGKL